MKTFEQHLSESVGPPGGFNVVYEAGMYGLTKNLERIVKALRDAGVHFEVVGGVAVNAHIYASHRTESFVTRNIDLLVHRHDLHRVAEAAQALGYAAKKMMGGYTLIRPGQDLGEAIHLLFVGERSKSTQPLPHPELHPEEKRLLNLNVPVAPLKDLLQMKLSSLCPEDLIHIETLDEVGLITPALEEQLSPILRQRLAEARTIIAENKPDVEG